jgi:hypothetical protein
MTVDLDDEDYEDIEGLAEALGLPERLPPLRLPPLTDLAAEARESALMRRVGELVAWMGPARPITEDGDLADAAEAAEHLGVTDVDVLRYWEVALATDLVVVSDTDGEATTNPDLWPTGEDEEDLGTWIAAFRQTLMSLEIDAELADQQDLTFEDAGALMLPLFLSRSLGVPVEDLREAARDMVTEELEDDAVWDAWVAEHGDPVTTLLARLADHGAVEVDAETARLTPLGMLATHEDLVEAGIDIPVLPSPEEMTAGDLLTAVRGLTPEELTEVTEQWLASRDDAAAVASLVAAAPEAEPAGRLYAIGVLEDLPEVPWPEMVEHPMLRPYALAVLEQDREPVDVAWVLLDLIASTENALGELDPDAVEPTMEPIVLEGKEEEVLAEAWRLPHPATHEVLTFIGTHHPDKKLAKAARAAAHKAQSATTSTPLPT